MGVAFTSLGFLPLRVLKVTFSISDADFSVAGFLSARPVEAHRLSAQRELGAADPTPLLSDNQSLALANLSPHPPAGS